MVFQNYALFPHMTVFDNVAFGLTLKPLSKDEVKKRTDDMLKLVQLTGYEERYPGQLSGGQQQRVAIARALVLHPRLMLFDEPLSNLDAKLRVEMRAEIKQIHAALGLTSIYVTHDQAEALVAVGPHRRAAQRHPDAIRLAAGNPRPAEERLCRRFHGLPEFLQGEDRQRYRKASPKASATASAFARARAKMCRSAPTW